MNVLNLGSLHLIHLLPFLCHQVAANTEIINFSSSRGPIVDLPLNVVGNWSKLYPADNEQQWSLEPATLHTPLHQVCESTDSAVAFHHPSSCPHELWLLLDLDDAAWASYATFTLRLSWPASTPTNLAITLYSPEELLAWLDKPGRLSNHPTEQAQTGTHDGMSTSTTRTRYARIRAVHAGIPTPGAQSRSHSHFGPVSSPGARAHAVPPANDDTPAVPPMDGVTVGPGERGEQVWTVPLLVVLEPVYWGVLPATLLPTVGFLITTVLAAVAFVPWVIAYVEPFVRQAREDMKTGMTGANKGR